MQNDWEQFRSIVDQSKPTIGPECINDLPRLYEHYRIPSSSNISIGKIKDILQAQICDALLLTAKNSSPLRLKALSDHIVGSHIISQFPTKPYLVILDIIRDALRAENANSKPRRGLRDFGEVASWLAACSNAHDLITLGSCFRDLETSDLTLRFPRVALPANCVAGLKRYGYKTIKMVDGHFHIDHTELDALVRSIEDRIRAYGGRDLASVLFLAISNLYNTTQARYHLGRRCSPTPTKIKPQIPIGFLLNLAVKPSNFVIGNKSDVLLKEIVELAIALGCVYDVQPYSIFESMFQTHENLISFLREISLYDSLFTFPQLRPSDTSKILNGLFDWTNCKDIEAKLGWAISDAIVIANKILDITLPQKTLIFSDGDIANSLPLGVAKTLSRILTTFTHQPPAPNSGLRTPEDIKTIDFDFRPLIPLAGQRVLMDSSWCGAAFYEAIAAELRRAGIKGVDDNIGLAAERFIKQELSKKGVTHLSGKYHHNGDGECDLVVETSNTIIFIEMKKKPLTRAARGGKDVNILLDISGSLIASQVQLGRHEILLRTQGYIDLQTSSGPKRLKLQGREIERISLSVLDYGGIQDRRVISQILNIALSSKFTPADLCLQPQFDILNKKCQDLQKQTNELYALGAWRNPHTPHFNCWFLSIPQFLVLLDDVKSNDDLKKELWETRHISMSSLDFYFELAMAKDIHARAQKPNTTP